MRLGSGRADGDVRTQLFQTRFRNAADGKQIIYAPEWPALLAKLNDVLGGDGAHAGQLLELFDRSGIQIDRFCRRLLLRLSNPLAPCDNKQEGQEDRPRKSGLPCFADCTDQRNAHGSAFTASAFPARRIP